MYPDDYPQLPNNAKDAHVGQLVRYGFGGPYLIVGIHGDIIRIKNLENQEEFDMVRM